MSSITNTRYPKEHYQSTLTGSQHYQGLSSSSRNVYPNTVIPQSVHHGRKHHSQQYLIKTVQPTTTLQRSDNITTIYCPVCKTTYSNLQINEHLQRHSQPEYYLKSRRQLKTTSTYQSIPQSGLQYPLVQPLEFQTSELNQVHKKGNIISTILETNKVTHSASQYTNKAVQTLQKPPLQYSKKETDLYNFMDNAFTSKSPFSINDVVSNNNGVASRRRLNEWEQIRHGKM